MNKRSGLTLLEMVMALGMAAIILIAISGAMSVAFNWQRRQPELKERRDRLVRFQDRMKTILTGAYLSSDAEDPAAYFVGDFSTGSGQFADQLTFTSVGTPPSGAFLAATDAEFEDLNLRFGPQSGLVEVGLSQVAVGSSPFNAGLYLREQRPADGDLTQGGYESMLDEDIEGIEFEFFDGTEWIGSWDTRDGGGARRLPAAVRVTYQLVGETMDRTFIVRLPHSDVTPDNPIVQETEGDEEAA